MVARRGMSLLRARTRVTLGYVVVTRARTTGVDPPRCEQGCLERRRAAGCVSGVRRFGRPERASDVIVDE